ncbi:NADPH-adrenodoxin reductase [Cryptotrichosporon argae]
MYERLPSPYGLARYGVAPDHPEVKNCQHKFDELAADPRFSFFGNVAVGPAHPAPSPSPDAPAPALLSPYTYPHAQRVPLPALLAHYHSTVLTYGSSLSNPLSIPGSSGSPSALDNVVPALAFVSWYNGHPAFADLNPDLSARAVEIIGQGNVALDVARILLSDPDALAATDMPTPVVDALRCSAVRHVRAVGRRGPGQVAFTTKEFREMTRLGVRYPGIDAGLLAAAHDMVGHERVRRRLLDLMSKPVEAAPEGSHGHGKTFELAFLRSPTAFRARGARPGRVDEVEYAVNALARPPPPGPAPPASQATAVPHPDAKAVMTAEREAVRAQLLIESVGYRSEALGNVPFDARRGRVRNEGGRVVDDDGQPVPGLYAAGWAARGPVGVIASTMADAFGLSAMLVADLAEPALARARTSSGEPAPGVPAEIARGQRDGTVIDMARWARIDAAEVERGRRAGKPREKFLRVEHMLEV